MIRAAAVIIVFGLVGTGTAMLVGVLARNADQAGSIGVVVGMVLGLIAFAAIRWLVDRFAHDAAPAEQAPSSGG